MKRQIFLKILFGFLITFIIMGSLSIYSWLRINNAKEIIVEKGNYNEAIQTYLRYNEASFGIMKSYTFTNSPAELERLRSEFALSSYNANKYLNILRGDKSYVFFLTEYYYNLAYSTSKELIYLHDINTINSTIKRTLSDEELLRLSQIDTYQKESAHLMDYTLEKSNSELAAAQQDFDDVWKQTMIFYLVGAILCAIISFLITKSIVNPIEQLTDVIQSTDKNVNLRNQNRSINDNNTIDNKDIDEIGYLNLSFNHLMLKLNDSYNKLTIEKERLEKSNLVKDEFLANISHELKTPLTSIKSYCDILDEGLQGELSRKQKNSLKIINESANSLLFLINTLLHISAYENKKMPLNLVKCDINKSMHEVIIEFRNILKKSNGSIKIISDKPEHLCNLDIDKTKEVFRNIISNAIKFKKENEKLRIVINISYSKNKKHVKISIRDNGIGIAKENLKHLFNKFYQVDQSFSRKAGGSGLGLAISKLIVTSSNGRINVKSILGKGTEVLVYFPSIRKSS